MLKRQSPSSLEDEKHTTTDEPSAFTDVRSGWLLLAGFAIVTLSLIVWEMIRSGF